MSREEAYEANARRCESRAAAATSETERYCWSMMAEAWLKLSRRVLDDTGLRSSIRRLIATNSSI
jgi:hypothetical protein